jgi:glutamate-5-semialdehyde dehydrogenase
VVKHIQQKTDILVIGNAYGICHIYVDRDADVDTAISVATPDATPKTEL